MIKASYQDEGYEYVEYFTIEGQEQGYTLKWKGADDARILKGREALEALNTKQDGESLIEPHESVVIQKVWYKRA
ncbi:hypothetical protein CCHR01_13113 [Colletotrichum chrysophilum]|uniref:Uncharacterized protein n=1 Tax=Colletotrichum chrysophilum TaxID=1836956 RepID=A0AAD9EE12_9PEZI|nr:hypothetical protein CCHR01_13113 [Colletotrichum chrysophilum]